MIAVSPIRNREAVRALFDRYHISFDEYSQAVEARSDETPVGHGLFTLRGNELTLQYVDYPAEDPTLCDLITRAVMNYGVNRGVIDCDLGPQAPKAALFSLGFLSSMEESCMNIIRVFTHCTACHEQKPKDF